EIAFARVALDQARNCLTVGGHDTRQAMGDENSLSNLFVSGTPGHALRYELQYLVVDVRVTEPTARGEPRFGTDRGFDRLEGLMYATRLLDQRFHECPSKLR